MIFCVTRRFIAAFITSHKWLYPKPHECNPQPPHTHFLKTSFNLSHPSVSWSSKWFLFFKFFEWYLLRTSQLPRPACVACPVEWVYFNRITGILWWSAYLLTPWSRVLLEKLASLQLIKKFPAFYGTRRFLTAPTCPRHLSLSWASPIQSSYPNPTSWRSILYDGRLENRI